MKILYGVFLMATIQMGMQNAFSSDIALHLEECFESNHFDENCYGSLEITPQEYTYIRNNFPANISTNYPEYREAFSRNASELLCIGSLLFFKLGSEFTFTSSLMIQPKKTDLKAAQQIHYLLGTMVNLMNKARPGSTMYI